MQYFKSIMTNPRFLVLCYFTLLMIVACSNQMVDFTHSQLTAIKQGTISLPKISISPNSSIFIDYDFPQACEIKTLLNQLQRNVQDKLEITNIDKYLKQLKQKFTQLLQASQKIKNLQKFIKNLPQIKESQDLVVQDKQLKDLLQRQIDLILIQDKINNKTTQLKQLVEQSMINQQNPLFKEASLKFQQKSLQEKIKLLSKLLEQSKKSAKDQQNQSSQKHVEQYFNSLGQFFKNQNNLLNELLQLLENYNELALIKAKISNLNTQIETHNLIIGEKEQCIAERQVIRNKQKNHNEIMDLMKILKQKKYEFNQNNQYCEGVVKKLIYRVKKLLASYDVVFICSQGIEQLINNRSKFQNQLRLAQQKLKELQDRQGIDQFKKRYNRTRQEMNIKIGQVSHFKLTQFAQSPQQIQKAIKQAKQKLEQIQKQLKQLQKPASKVDRSKLFARIQQLIVQLKVLKNQHCSLQSQYEETAKKIYQKVYAIQQQNQYNLNIQKIHFDKINDLRQAQIKMQNIQNELLEILNK